MTNKDYQYRQEIKKKFAKPEEKTQANNFFEAMKNDPKAIIEWYEEEIEAYQKLIKLIKSNE